MKIDAPTAEDSDASVERIGARERFLAEASTILASSLDYATTVQRVAELAVPVLGDWCGVDIVEPDGTLRQLAVAHADPEKVMWAREFRRRYPPRADATSGSTNVVRTGISEFYPDVTSEQLERAAIDTEHLRAIRELDIHGVIVAPLCVSGRTIGSLSFVSSSTGRRYTMADVAVAEELGRRAALAIDNARLYSAEREARRAAEDSAARAGLLHAVMTELSQAVSPTDVADVALSQGSSALGAEHAVMYRVSADGKELEMLKAVGLEAQTGREFRSLPIDAPLPLSEAIRSRTTLYLESRSELISRFPALREANARGTTMPAWAMVPLIVGGRPVGGIAFGFLTERKFDAIDREFMASLAQQLAQAFDRSRLYELEHEARESAQAANRAKSDFLATMSHELRTPINAIQGYAQLLDLGIPGPVTQQQRDYLSRLTLSAQHLLGLVNEVLDLAKIESGTIQVNVDHTVAGGTVDAALSLVRPQAMAKGILLSEQCEGARHIPYIGDEHRVRQIIANLLSNAVKFTKAGGRINVSCSVTDAPPGNHDLIEGSPYVVFRVRDTGCGIAPDQVERIFEPFTQAETGRESTYTRGASGTGLGLTISRRLARLMGGELAVESTPGVGSEFRLLLPAPERRAEPRDRRATDGEADQGQHAGSRKDEDAGPGHSPQFRQGGRIFRIGDGLVASVGPVVDAWVARIRDNPIFEHTRSLDSAQLQDHVATFVADMALALRFLDTGEGEPSALLRDGTAIMRTIAEQHGAQRYRIGWSEPMIEMEMTLLSDTMSETIKRIAGADSGLDSKRAVSAVEQFIAQATRHSLASFRFAASMNTEIEATGQPAFVDNTGIIQPS